MSGEVTYRTIEKSFDPDHNSLSFLRLVLAVSVVASHTVAVGAYGASVFGRVADVFTYNLTSLGAVAVYSTSGDPWGDPSYTKDITVPSELDDPMDPTALHQWPRQSTAWSSAKASSPEGDVR